MSVYERCLCKLLTAGKDEKDHKWYGLIESRKKGEFVRRVHVSEVEDADRRGRLLGRWKDKVKKLVLVNPILGEAKCLNSLEDVIIRRDGGHKMLRMTRKET